MNDTMLMRPSLLVLIAVAVAAPAWAAGIPPGTYLCKAGSSRLMLTLGEMTVSGNGYSFHAPTGNDTRGTFEERGGKLAWHGDIGAITNAQIVESALDRAPNSFWFTYRAAPNASPTSASCSM